MALSPGIYYTEVDKTFNPPGSSPESAGFVGTFVKGRAFEPITVKSPNEFIMKFGNPNPENVAGYAVMGYLNNATLATVVRVLPSEGYSVQNPILVKCNGVTVAVLAPTYNHKPVSYLTGPSFASSTVGTPNSASNFILNVSGSSTTLTPYTLSLDPVSPNFIKKVFSDNPKGNTPLYCYMVNERFYNSALSNSVVTITASFTPAAIDFDSMSFSEARTPWVVSQLISNTRYRLFRFVTHSHGDDANTEIKVGIQDIKISNDDYTTFTVVVRGVNKKFGSTDNDMRPDIKEIFSNVNLNPLSPDYIVKKIGDMYSVHDQGKSKYIGDYPNKSNYIRVELATGADALNPQVAPYGFEPYIVPLSNAAVAGAPTVQFVNSQIVNGVENNKVFYGFDFEDNTNMGYLKPIPRNAGTASNVVFSLENVQHPVTGVGLPPTASNSLQDMQRRKFIMGFQGGFDGMCPSKPKANGSEVVPVNGFNQGKNIFGLDVSGPNTDGTAAYKKGIDILSNKDVINISSIYTPGILHKYHSNVTNHVMRMVLDREDVFYVMGCVGIDDSINDAVDTVSSLDINYAATYYPWVKINDSDNNVDVWVSPDVIIPEVISYNDLVGFQWDAPAGITRGRLNKIKALRNLLTRDERDILYTGKINPLVYFSGRGFVVWGQKTLQTNSSALDRINVRRLLINLKKFIDDKVLPLVFEGNTVETRTRFINIVTPYMESVKNRQGLYAYQVVMDESNNTPDVIDQNMMKGDIYLQPTRTAEIIPISFNLMKTGVKFNN